MILPSKLNADVLHHKVDAYHHKMLYYFNVVNAQGFDFDNKHDAAHAERIAVKNRIAEANRLTEDQIELSKINIAFKIIDWLLWEPQP